ncbi:MAG: SDR family NAD(P)-dependent oxidoreductase [Bdellovibrionales bacterium]
MTKVLQDKIALVTGASRGIGASVAKAYAREGAHVILLGRTIGALEEVHDEIVSAGGVATIMPVDLLDFDALSTIGPTIFEKFGGLDIFVANAGVLGTLRPLAQTPPKEWSEVMNANLMANFQMIRSLDPLLRASSSGRVIFVTSGVVPHPRSYWGAYTVSKAALESLAQTYACETEKTNIKVNIVDPGRVRTDMRAQAYPGEDPQTLPHPDEIVSRFIALASPVCTEHGARVNV